MGPPQIDNWSLTGHPSEILGLRPSLFSSPGKLLPEQILEDGPEDLSQGEHPGLNPTLASFRTKPYSDAHQVCSLELDSAGYSGSARSTA